MSGPLFDRMHGAAARGCASAAAPRAYLLVHAVRVDHPARSSAFRVRPRPPVLLHVDGDRALPLLALDEAGTPLARFRHLATLAWFLRDDLPIIGTIGAEEPPTLPHPIAAAARREALAQGGLL